MSSYRARFSPTTGATSTGMPPIELWGVAQTDRRAAKARSAKARARRRAKREAKGRGMTLKAYLREKKP